ncbi:hypothetical protein FS837_012884 [Tulasnella sp. UAMH 9824]|nr:hypothetical protein FS837_012884 [Tulasnella sp. UAMH 9824]
MAGTTPLAVSNVLGRVRGYLGTPEYPDGINVVVKVLRLSGQAGDGSSLAARLGKHLGREIFAWQIVKHPRITPLVGYIREYRDGIVPCIVTKWRQQGNLANYLERNPRANRFQLLDQALEALVYLHNFSKTPIIHFDVKRENILIDDNGEAELCDFGYAKVVGEHSGYTTGSSPGGTYPYISPEVLNEGVWADLTPAADVFAIGSTILFVLSNRLAWYYIRSKAGLINKVSNGIPPARDRYVMNGSKAAVTQLWELLESCWSLEQNNRPSSQEVLDELRAIEAMGGVGPPI